jgi:cell division protein FtsN
MIAIRLGYRRELGSSGDPSNGLSYGLGVHVGPLNVDYSMTPDNAFADVHRLSFGYTFGGSEAKPEPKKPEPKYEPATPKPAAPKAPPVIASATPTPKAASPAPTAAAVAQAPMTKGQDLYEVVLGNYQSEQSAQSELKALQILGFDVKDARLTLVPGEGYRLSLARLNSRKSADDLASTLTKLSFQPRVEVAHR